MLLWTQYSLLFNLRNPCYLIVPRRERKTGEKSLSIEQTVYICIFIPIHSVASLPQCYIKGNPYSGYSFLTGLPPSAHAIPSFILLLEISVSRA